MTLDEIQNQVDCIVWALTNAYSYLFKMLMLYISLNSQEGIFKY